MSSAPTRKELSHERIVNVAARAIRRAGYRGVGVADIMKEAGLTHGGFYAHFSSRDALLVEAMQRAGRHNQRWRPRSWCRKPAVNALGSSARVAPYIKPVPAQPAA